MRTVKSVNDFLRKNYADDYEICVVNDGSGDRTAEEIGLLKEDIPGLSLINLPENRGKGAAVREGMRSTKGEIRLFMDADGSTSIECLDTLLPYLDRGFDVVMSSRRVRGARILGEQPAHRIFLGWIFRKITQFVTLLDIVDSQNGFKMFRGYAADEIFSRVTVSGWAFDVEVAVIAQALGYRTAEVPIVWQNDPRSKVRFSGMLRMLVDLIAIGWRLRRGVYGAGDRGRAKLIP